MLNYVLALMVAARVTAQGIEDWRPNALLSVDSKSPTMYKLDPLTGQTIGELPLFLADSPLPIAKLSSLAIHPFTGAAWVVAQLEGRPGNERTLGVVNLISGAVDVQFSINYALAPIAFDCDGNMYGMTGPADPTDPDTLFVLPLNEYSNMTRLLPIQRNASGQAVTWRESFDGANYLFHADGGKSTQLYLDQINVQEPAEIVATYNITGDANIQLGYPMALHYDRFADSFLWVRDQDLENIQSPVLYSVSMDGVASEIGALDHRPRGISFAHSFCDPCENPCSGHGSCWDGICWCDETWRGKDCSMSNAPAPPTPSPAPCPPETGSAYSGLFWTLALGNVAGFGYYWFKVRRRNSYSEMEGI